MRRYAGGLVLTGGDPPRALRLTPAGRNALNALLAGEECSAAARRLGRRVVDAGVAHPRPAQSVRMGDVTVVIPVRDRPDGLARCLQSLDSVPAVVVDDGSRDSGAVAAVCERHGVTLLAQAPAGPAAARNRALEKVETGLVAFLDSDCVAPADWLEPLTAHFADPLVAAVAPRVRPVRPGPVAGWRERFAADRSPLDMGDREAAVRPGSRVSYVPTAALVVRRAALGRGFDPQLRYGEDVDLVWRLHDEGWRVRYDPRVVVEHDEPSTWARLLARRLRYGASAAPLSRRHPGRLAPVRIAPRAAAPVTLLLARRPAFALAAGALQAGTLARRLADCGVPRSQALPWSLRAATHTLSGLGRAATTMACPVALASLTAGRARPAALALLAAPALAERAHRGAALDPLRWTLACLLDDAAYGTGVWAGCIRERTIGPLLPRVTSGRRLSP